MDTLSTVDFILKRQYSTYVPDTVAERSAFWRRVKKGAEDLGGEGMTAYIPTIYGHSQAHAAILETGTLPTAQNVSGQRMQVPLKYQVGQISVTQVSIEATRSSKYAFMKSFQVNMETMGSTCAKQCERQLWGDGTALLGYVQTGATSATVQLRTATSGDPGSEYFEVGMFIDAYTAAAPPWAATPVQRIDNIQVTGVNRVLHQLTLASSQTFTAGDLIFRANHFTPGAGGDATLYAQYEMMGLLGLVDGPRSSDGAFTFPRSNVGNFQGINRALTTWGGAYNAFVLNNVVLGVSTPRALNTALLLQGIIGSRARGTAPVDAIFSHPEIQADYMTDMLAMRQYEALKVDPGYSSIVISVGVPKPIPWYGTEFYCPRNRLFGLRLEDFKIHWTHDWEWWNAGGAIAQRTANPSTLAVEATTFMFANLGADRAVNCFRIDDLEHL